MAKKKKAPKKTTPTLPTTEAKTPTSSAPQPPTTGSVPKSKDVDPDSVGAQIEVSPEEDRLLHMSTPEVIKTVEEADYHPDDEEDNVPDSQPDVQDEDDEEEEETVAAMGVAGPAPSAPKPAEPLYDVPEPAKFAKLVQEAQRLTEFKLQGQLARLIHAGILPDKNLWKTEKRHQVPKMALAQCQDIDVLKHEWPMVRWMRGRTLGNASNEMRIVMSWALLGVITELMVDDIAEE